MKIKNNKINFRRIILIVSLLLFLLVFVLSTPSFSIGIPFVGITNASTVSPICLGIKISQKSGERIFPVGEFKLKILGRYLGYRVVNTPPSYYERPYCVGMFTSGGE